MFKVRQVKIDGFWLNYEASCVFNDDVNIIIGRNGTGKTTFMNLLHSALSVDLSALVESDFNKIEIKISNGVKNKTIKVEKIITDNELYQLIEYQISTKKFKVKASALEPRRTSANLRRRMNEESETVREILNGMVSLSSLSVYRLRNIDDFEIMDKRGRRLVSPVDFRLSQLTNELTQYQIELFQRAREISADLQKDVLASILYTEVGKGGGRYKIPMDFDKKTEEKVLISAYKKLNVNDSKVIKKISKHISVIDKAVMSLKVSRENKDYSDVNFAALDAYERTQNIITMSLKSEELEDDIYSQLNLFISILKDFIPSKDFSFLSGALVISSEMDSDIPIEKLSSGEKQLLILLIETLLQRCKPFVYLTDEPELSLHIEWQRKIIPAVKKLNNNAQIIAATHSPEVASKYRSFIINMKDVIND
jgi:ABC-type cobalamin/Fe3+-siderophores transport system ATPase subunit